NFGSEERQLVQKTACSELEARAHQNSARGRRASPIRSSQSLFDSWCWLIQSDWKRDSVSETGVDCNGQAAMNTQRPTPVCAATGNCHNCTRIESATCAVPTSFFFFSCYWPSYPFMRSSLPALLDRWRIGRVVISRA